MDIRQFVKEKLETILETYHVDIPQDNTIFPCCVFYVSERPKTSGDDHDYGREITVNVEGYIDGDGDFGIFDQMEEAILSENDLFFGRLIDKGDILGTEKIGVSFIFEFTKL